MSLNKIPHYQIRNYVSNDAEQIGTFDNLLELSYKYNPDFLPSNIFCAVDSDEEILGVGHIEPHETWHLIEKENVSSDFIYRLLLRISLNPKYANSESIKGNILKQLIIRAKEIRQQYPDKKIRLFTWIDSTELDEMDFYLAHGFATYSNSLVMKYDLTMDIPDVPQPDGITVKENNMVTEEELQRYYNAASIAFSGVVWSLNYIRWMKCGPEWKNFSAFYGDQLVGNTMTWMIEPDHSTSEDIFVLPEWRNRGIAKYVITEALKYLKKQGKALATLSVYGDNVTAISLYNSLGYRMHYMMIECGYDL
ncbi:GNAT family N-acetyltransferase [Vallitalea okinawensis]|uniref:GNAT family N-acetyltransferase n=1 Tax=Vallitalea okinawensis TaxID=2078660 RepID=UPI000CFD7276|nr:GNAT family N-acetyltransferase [Vallitalea okinawensis]